MAETTPSKPSDKQEKPRWSSEVIPEATPKQETTQSEEKIPSTEQSLEKISEEEFALLLKDSSRRLELLSAIEQEESVVNALVSSLGKKKSEMNQMEADREVEGWSDYTKELASFKKFFKELGGGYAPLGEQVINARYVLWKRFFERSGKTMESMQRLLGGHVETQKGIAEKKEINSGSSIDAKPETKEKEKSSEDPHAWREGIKKFTGDLEYRKHYEDWLDSIHEKLMAKIDDIPEQEREAYYRGVISPVEALKKDIYAIFASQEMGEVNTGMYGQGNDIEYSAEEKKTIDEKIKQVLSIADGVATDFNNVESASLHKEEKTIETPVEAPKVAETPETPVTGQEQISVSPEFEVARKAWMEARTASDSAEVEYRTALATHYKSLEEQKIWTGGRWKNEFNKFFGFNPELPDSLKELQQKTIASKEAYVKAGSDLQSVKYEAGDAKAEKIRARYERLLAQKLLITNGNERLELQKSVITEAHPNRDRFNRLLEKMRQYPKTRMIAPIAAYALIGAATGGVGAAAVLATRKATGLLFGAMAGATAGTAVNVLVNKLYVEKKEGMHSELQETAKSTLFEGNFADAEKAFEASARSVAAAKKRQRIATVTAAGIAGALAGSTSGAIMDSISPGPSVSGVSTPDRNINTFQPGSPLDIPAEVYEHVVEPKEGTSETKVPSDAVHSQEFQKDLATLPKEVPQWTTSDAETFQKDLAKLPVEPVPQVAEHSQEFQKDLSHLPQSTSPETFQKDLSKLPSTNIPETFQKDLSELPLNPSVPETPKTPNGLHGFRLMEDGSMSDMSKDLGQEVPVTDSKPETPSAPELVGTDMYEVQRGDNLWNILEGDVKGRPMSEVLESIPPKDRDAALSRLFEKVDKDPALREAIGMKSDHADKIFVGEKLNIFALDKALGETYLEMQNGKPNSGDIRIPEPRPSVPIPESKPGIENVVTPEVQTEVPKVYEDSIVPKQVISESMPENRLGSEAVNQAEIAKVYEGITTPLDTKESSIESVSSEASMIESRTKDDVATTPETPTEKGQVLSQEVEARKQTIIDAIEKPKGGIFTIFGGPNIQGTFKGMEDLTFDRIAEAQQNAQIRTGLFIERNLTEEGWNKWVDEVNRLVESGADIESKDTLGSFMNRVAENQARNGVVT